MDSGLEIQRGETVGKTVVLRVRGRLDARTAPQLLQRVTPFAGMGRNLVLNLAEVTFMGSSGVGVLLAAAQAFQDRKGSVRLVAPSAAVVSVVKLLNLEPFLKIDATEDAALAALAAR
jgi:stage II sporulation protein AA (anti-sigma F factor antagonist)